MVYASSSAWVGCSWVPSPALTTLPFTHWASRCGAPEAGCRTTIASDPIASSVSAVSLRLSPLETLLPLAEKLMTSAESRLAASSKEMRVRVESSKKRLTTVRPRSVGSFLTSRPASAESICAAVSRTSVASARSRSPASSRCRFTVSLVRLRGRSAPRSQPSLRCPLPVASLGIPLRQQDLVHAVGLGQPDLDLLAAGGRHVLADVVGADRQLPVAAVDQDRELHRPRPAEVAQRVQGGPDRAPGEQDVVDEDHEPAVDARAGQLRGLQRADPAQPQVVAVQRDVDGPDVDRGSGERLDAGGQPPGEGGTAGGDADQHQVGEELTGLLDELVGHAVDDAGDVGGGEQRAGRCGAARFWIAGRSRGRAGHQASFPASRDGSLKEWGGPATTVLDPSPGPLPRGWSPAGGTGGAGDRTCVLLLRARTDQYAPSQPVATTLDGQ